MSLTVIETAHDVAPSQVANHKAMKNIRIWTAVGFTQNGYCTKVVVETSTDNADGPREYDGVIVQCMQTNGPSETLHYADFYRSTGVPIDICYPDLITGTTLLTETTQENTGAVGGLVMSYQTKKANSAIKMETGSAVKRKNLVATYARQAYEFGVAFSTSTTALEAMSIATVCTLTPPPWKPFSCTVVAMATVSKEMMIREIKSGAATALFRSIAEPIARPLQDFFVPPPVRNHPCSATERGDGYKDVNAFGIPSCLPESSIQSLVDKVAAARQVEKDDQEYKAALDKSILHKAMNAVLGSDI